MVEPLPVPWPERVDADAEEEAHHVKEAPALGDGDERLVAEVHVGSSIRRVWREFGCCCVAIGGVSETPEHLQIGHEGVHLRNVRRNAIEGAYLRSLAIPLRHPGSKFSV